MRGELHLLQLEVDSLIDPIHELVDTGIDSREDRCLLVYLEFKFGEQILIERVLRRLYFIEEFHDLSLSRISRLILLLGLLDDFVC